MLLKQIGFKVVLVLILLEVANGSEKFDLQKKITITLRPNSQFEIQLPQTNDQHSIIHISSFRNQDSQGKSSPCLLQKQQQSIFRKEGEIGHSWLLVSEDSLFWRGNIWDIIQVKNTIVVVFEDGEVTYFKTKNQSNEKDVSYFQKRQIVRILDENLAYGRLFQYKEGPKTHIIYMSQNGCYLVETQSWIKLYGYEGDRFSDAIIMENKIITANRGKLKIYQLSLIDFRIELEAETTVFSLDQFQKIILTVSSLYYDEVNDRIYLIDDYQGVKFINMQNYTKSTHIQAQHLLSTEKCQDIVMAQQLLFISCSSLIVVNATSLSLLQEIQYPFHINRIYYSQGELIAFGDHQVAVYLVIKPANFQIKVDFLFRGNLTGKVYQHYHYLYSSKYILLFSESGLEYGKIVAPNSTLKCAYRYITGRQQYQQMVGINRGELSINSRCKQNQNSLYYNQCLNKYDIQIKIHDIRGIKFIFWVLLGLLILVLAITSSYKMITLIKEKQQIDYLKQREDQPVYVQEGKGDQKSIQMMQNPKT